MALDRSTPGVARTAIVGVGHSKVYRKPDVALGILAVEACRRAIEDAGLELSDIDGVVVDPHQPFDGSGSIDGIHHVSPDFIINALGLDVCWYEANVGSMGRSMIEGVNAVSSGNCKSVLVFRALSVPSGRYGQAAPKFAEGPFQYLGPYGLFAPAMFAHLWTRYMHLYGTTREDMAPFIVNNRRNALLYEDGYWAQHKPQQLTEQDYLDGRMISSPLSLFDCDIPVQGCGAFVVTSAERARDLRHKPAYVRGWAMPGSILPGGGYFTELDIVHEQTVNFADHLYTNSGVTASDIDVLNVYDGFSIFVPLWLEALGFCGEGEGFAFMDPERISLEGALPVNTSSGSLGAGRMHGVPQFYDSVLQLQGRAGARQVKKDVDVVLVTAGGRPGMAPGVVLSSQPS